MKKLLCVLIATVAVLSLVACSSWKSTVSDFDGEVSSNGGFAVVKGEYVYLINGVSENSGDNAFGNAVKGAIVRVKKSDLGKDNAVAETVIPKIVYNEYTENGAGLFISGNYVYFPSPCDKKNSQGVVKNTETEFIKAKLDGSEVNVVATIASSSVPYRFYEAGGKVFLTVYVTETADDESKNYLVTYDEGGSQLKKSSAVTGYDFGEFGGKYAYYTHVAHNDELDSDESFNEVYRYAFDGSEDKIVLSGKDFGAQGNTYSIVKNAKDFIVLSASSVDTSVASATYYYGVAHADVVGTTAENFNKLTFLSSGTNASTIFASTSVYCALDAILYNTSDGIKKYDYKGFVADKLDGGVSVAYYDKDLASYTYSYTEGGVMYYTDGGYYYSVNAADVLAGTATVKRLTYKSTYSTGSWYNAEFIGDYMLYADTDSPFYGYVYAVGLKDIEARYNKALADITDDEVDEYVEELSRTEIADVEAKLAKRLGIVSAEDAEKLLLYYVDNYEEE